ncbi:MAG: permease prefix domain 1-containing protein [Phycisphaerales bacterium]
MIATHPPTVPPSPPPAPPSAQVARDDDAIATWLDLFARLLNLPEHDARDIRDEIETHLRERVRDMLVEGVDEHEAVRRAVAELGGAATLARRFRAAGRGHRRRLAMNMAMLSAAGGAMVLSVVAVSRPGGVEAGAPAVRHQVYQPATRAPRDAGPKSPSITANDASLEDVFNLLTDGLKTPMTVRWASLGEAGLDREARLNVHVPPGAIEGAFDALNDALAAAGQGDAALDHRTEDGVIVVATRAYFDRRESVLAAYDIEPVAAAGVDCGELVQVITQFVDPDGWKQNGGDLATMTIVGPRLFVQAPPRFHEGVKWFIAQLSPEPQPRADAAGNDAPAADDPLVRLEQRRGAIRRSDQVMLSPELTVNVRPTMPLAGRFLEQVLAEQLLPVEPTFRAIPLMHTSADAVHTAVQAVAASVDGSGLKILSDHMRNSVIVQGSAEQVEAAAQAIAKMDELVRVLKEGPR